jgi:acyl-CoA reductase-like NAD-dependent aldehyde dehydrogenase
MPGIAVPKTYKIYIGGKFVRSESGRYQKLIDKKNNFVANVCRCSAKDIKNAVVSAKQAQHSWQLRTAYNRGQILYRIAETLEGRSGQFVDTLRKQGMLTGMAVKEFELMVDTFIYYAGWCDKYQQVFGSVNPVQSSHYNFSVPEPTGVVGAFLPVSAGPAVLAGVLAPAIVGGNTIVAVTPGQFPLSAIELAEVLAASDVPNGVVNILTGNTKELLFSLSTHKDVNAIAYLSNDREIGVDIRKNAAANIKRTIELKLDARSNKNKWSPYTIMDFQELKTTWHPVGV